MAAKPKKNIPSGQDMSRSLSSSMSTMLSIETLTEQLKQTKSDLDRERGNVKQLQHEKIAEVKAAREQEQRKASIALGDLKTKLHQDKLKEFDALRQTLMKKYDHDMEKAVKLKEVEITRLEIENARIKAMSASDSPIKSQFKDQLDSERNKLLQEISDLKQSNKQLEESHETISEAERQRHSDLRKTKEDCEIEVAKIKRDLQQEIRKLVEELKTKDKLISGLEKDLGLQTGNYVRLQLERKSENSSPRTLSTPQPMDRDSEMSSSLDEGDKLRSKIGDLNSKIRKLEYKNAELVQEKAELLRRIHDLDKKWKPLQDRNKKFLEKNMELSSINRQLEEKIKVLTDDNNKLKSQMNVNKRRSLALSKQLLGNTGAGKTGGKMEALESLPAPSVELEDLRQQCLEHTKQINALKQACTEKDRKIEIIKHARQRSNTLRAQNKAAGIKETYYGYDEDSCSVDSEFSVASIPLDPQIEEEFWDDITREEFERNYQRLNKEHMELEKAYALLQKQQGSSHVDPQREHKLRTQLENDLLASQSKIEDLEKIVQGRGGDSSWVHEKQKMNEASLLLMQKIKEAEARNQLLKHELNESQEQNEVLEFRNLELEDKIEKLIEELKHSTPYHLPPVITEAGVLTVQHDSIGVMEVKVEELREKISDLKYDQDAALTPEEKLVLIQVQALLDVTEKKLNSMTAAQGTLRSRIKELEQEKADLLSAATGVSPDIVLEYEEVRNSLMEAEMKIQQLEKENEDLKQAEALYKYTDDFNQKSEARYKQEIERLKKQLASMLEGKAFESEYLQEKVEQLKAAEQRNQEVKRELEVLKQNNSELQDQLLNKQEEQSEAECDKDMNPMTQTLLHKISELENARRELTAQNEELQVKISGFTERYLQYEQNEQELTEKTIVLEEELEAARALLSEDGPTNRANNNQGDKTEQDTALSPSETKKLQQELKILRDYANNREQELQELHKENASLKSQLEENVKLLSTKEYDYDEEAGMEVEHDDDDISIPQEQTKDNQKNSSPTITKALLQDEQDGNSGNKKHSNGTDKEEEEDEIKLLQKKISDLTITQLTLKGRIHDLETSEAILRDTMEKMDRDEVELRQQLKELRDSEHKNKDKLAERELTEQALEEKVKVLELAEHNAVEKQQALEEVNARLQEKLAQFEELEKDVTLVETLRDTIKKKEKSIRKLQDQIVALEDNNEILKEQLEQITQGDTDKIHVLEDKVQELQELNDRLVSGDTEALQTRSMVDSARVKELEASIQELETSKKALQEQLHQICEEKDDKIEKLHERIHMHEENEAKLSETLNEMEFKEKMMESKLSMSFGGGDSSFVVAQEQKYDRLESFESDISGQFHDMENRIHELEEEETKLKAKIDELEKAQVKSEEELRQKEKEISELGSKAEDLESSLQSKIESLTSEITSYEQQVQMLKVDIATNEKEHKAEIDKLHSTIESLKSSAKLTEDKELSSKIEESLIMKESVLKLDQEKAELSEMVTKLTSETESSRAKVQELESKEKDVLHQLLQLANSLGLPYDTSDSTCSKLCGSITQEVMTTKEKLSGLEEKHEKLSSELEAEQERMKELDLVAQSSRHEVQLEVTKVKQACSDLQEKLHSLEQTNIQLINKSKELETEKEATTSHYNELQMAAKLWESEKEKLVLDCKKAIQKADLVESEKEKLQVQMEEMEKDAQTLRNKDDRRLKELENEEKSLLSKLSAFQDIENELEAFKTISKQQTQELENKNRELTKAKGDLEEEVKNLELRNSDLLRSNLELRKMTAELEERILGLESLSEALNNKTATALSKATQMPEIEAQESEVLQHSITAESPQSPHFKKVETLEDEIRHLQVQNNQLQEELAEVTARLEQEQQKPQAQHIRIKTADETAIGTSTNLHKKVHQLEVETSAKSVQIEELEQHLTSLRTAVEQVISAADGQMSLEDINKFSTPVKAAPSSGDYEARLQDLVRSEADLKQRLAQMEKKEKTYRASIQEMEEADSEYRSQITQLQERVATMEAAEVRLKSKLKQTRKEIQRGSEAEESDDLSAEFGQSPSKRSKTSENASLHRQIDQLKEQIQEHRSKEEALNEKLASLQDGDGAVITELQDKVWELEAANKSLKRKIQLLEDDREQNPANLHLSSVTMLDTPEDILKQRIQELEKMDRHLRQQVMDLEQDREELHQIARKDKSLIHELNVRIRELTLSERSLQLQASRYEDQENDLYAQIDRLEDRISDLEDQLQDARHAEKRLATSLNDSQFSLEEFENKADIQAVRIEELQEVELKLLTRLQEMEKEKIALQNSRDRLNIELEEMTNRETSLSNKIRTLENDNIVLEGKVVQLEYADSAAQDRIKDLERRNTDLENRNETALMKVHQLEETKANLKFEVSDLQIQLQEFQQEVEKAGDVESSLKKQIVALQTTSRNMQDSLSDTSAREMELLNKLQEHEQHEAVLKEKIVALESSELKLKYKIQELGATVSTAENRVTSAKNLEEENHLLHRQIDDQQRKVRNLDQEIQTLNEKLVAYENPGKSNGFVRVLAKELSELRAQKAWVEEAEKTVTRLEKSEARLKETVQQLREGKDVCGHEGQLKDLKDEVNRLKALEKAYDMLQDNYSKLRENFTILYQGVKSGDVKLENITLPPDIQSPDSNLTPRSQAIVDFVDQLPLEDVPLLSAVAPSMSSPAGPGVIEEMEWKQIENTNKSSTSKLAELSDLWGHIEKTTAVSSAPSESGPAPAVPSSKPPVIPGKATHADGSVIEDSFYLPSTQVPEGDVDSADEAPSLAEDIPLSGRVPPPLPKSKPPSPPTSGVTGSVSTPATPPKGYRPPVPPKPPTPSWLKRRSHIDQLNPDVILLERVHAKEIKDWETKVEGLERKLKNQESELSLFKDSLPASGAKGASDLAMWKAKLRDRERQLEVKEKIVKDQRDQILKLEKELAEKRRELTFAQEEISRLDRLVRSKNLVGPDSPLPSLHRMQRERLADTGRTSEKNMLDWLETSREEHQLKKELQNKEQELFSKNIEIDQLNKKLKDKQEKVERLEAEMKQHKTPEKSGLKSREASPPDGSLSAKISPSRTEEDGQSVTAQAQLEAEQKELRIRLNNTLEELRDKKEELSKANNTMTPLKAKVTRLAKKCKQKDNLLHRAAKDMSNCGMHGRLVSKIEHELETSSNGSDRRSSEKFSSCSSSPPKKAKKSNTKNDSHDHQTTDDQTEMDSMVWSLDDHSDHSGETSVATASDFDDLPYTTRVKSKHGQLNNERIKRHPTEPHQRTSEKKRKSKHGKQKPHGGEDTDLFRAVSDYRPELFSQSRHPNLELPLKEGELVQVLGPPDQDGYYETRLGGRVGLVPASYLQPVYTERTVDDTRRERSRPGELALPSHLDTSPEQILGMHSALEQAFHPGPYPIGHGFETGDNMVEQQLPVNLALSLSQSLQLPPPSIMNQNMSPFNQLQPQQQQTANGQSSLGNYLQTVPSNDLVSPNGASLRNGLGHVDQQQAYSGLSGSNFPLNSNNTDRRSNNSYHPTTRSRVSQRTAGNPDPPSQFSMEQILSDLSVLLSWQPPEMDEFGRNNDSIVKGYKILVNGREAEVVRSPHQCKVLIENQNLRRPVQFSIQTLAENGRMSATTDLMLGEFPRAASRNSMPPHSATEEDGDVDDDDDVASFVSNDDHYRKGERRIFVAVYDYIPSRQSPNKVSAYELVIKAGDVITTFGLQRADGFFFAEVNGRRGLVPASFIEEFSAIQKSNSNLVSRKAGKLSSHKNSEHSSSEQSNVSTGSRSKGQPKRMEKYKDTRL